MPTYGYICTSCGHQEDRLQKISDAPLTVCPQCHKADFQRQISAGIGVSSGGSGFYETD
ncbi:MAG: zinc ribbon domain-containing protein [Chlamydiia bacterium]|nr:zinc ribbon domain-containing protein [Chlamydiia bacterium]